MKIKIHQRETCDMNLLHTFIRKPGKKQIRAQEEALRLKQEMELKEDLDQHIKDSKEIQNSNLEVQKSSLQLAVENHKLNQEMKILIAEYEQKDLSLKEKENILLKRENELNDKHKEIDERIAEIRKEEILIEGRKNELLRNEKRVEKKDTDLDEERKNIKEQKKEASESKEKYENLKDELEAKRAVTERLNEEAAEKTGKISKLEAEIDSIYEKAKIVDAQTKKKEDEFEQKCAEIENSLKEKIDEYDRKIKGLDKFRETINDIEFDSTEDGKQAKIVVKEAIRQSLKYLEDIQTRFKEVEEKYCDGTFKGFAVPIGEIDKNFEELKFQFEQIKDHAESNGLYDEVEDWLSLIQECIIKADEEMAKWEFSECYRNILFGLASCKNYEMLIGILNTWSSSQDESADEEDINDFVDYYEILHVDKTASDEEIKKAYSNLAKEYHPDKQYGKSDEEKAEAEEKMRQLNEAKDILLDKNKRKIFDEKRNQYR